MNLFEEEEKKINKQKCLCKNNILFIIRKKRQSSDMEQVRKNMCMYVRQQTKSGKVRCYVMKRYVWKNYNSKQIFCTSFVAIARAP